MTADKCLRCGQCCVGCPHLKYGRQIQGAKITHSWCNIWKKRNQAIKDGKYLIISGHACLPRELDKRIFPGCPLNQDSPA